MTANYRLDAASNRAAFYQLYLYAFNGQDTDARRQFFNARYAHAWIYGIQHDGALTSGLYSLPFTVDFHGVDYRMNGIGDVMTAPEFSGHGGAGTLIKAALADMLEQHVTLSYLAPFSYSYYRRFGYEQVFNHVTYTINRGDVPQYRPQTAAGRVVRSSLADALSVIKPLYAQRRAELSGGLVREDWWWDYLTLKNQWDAAVYYDDQDVAQGYMVYERSATTLTVHKLLTNTTAAFEQLAAFTFRHGNTFAQLRYESADSRYHGDWFANPDTVVTVVTPYMMARIVDLADFSQRYPYRHDFEPVRIAVTDNTLSANNGTWSLSRADSKVTVERTTDSVDISVSIQQLTKAMMGTTSLTTLLQRGEGSGDLDAAQRLDRALQDAEPQVNDYF